MREKKMAAVRRTGKRKTETRAKHRNFHFLLTAHDVVWTGFQKLTSQIFKWILYDEFQSKKNHCVHFDLYFICFEKICLFSRLFCSLYTCAMKYYLMYTLEQVMFCFNYRKRECMENEMSNSDGCNYRTLAFLWRSKWNRWLHTVPIQISICVTKHIDKKPKQCLLFTIVVECLFTLFLK